MEHEGHSLAGFDNFFVVYAAAGRGERNYGVRAGSSGEAEGWIGGKMADRQRVCRLIDGLRYRLDGRESLLGRRLRIDGRSKWRLTEKKHDERFAKKKMGHDGTMDLKGRA